MTFPCCRTLKKVNIQVLSLIRDQRNKCSYIVSKTREDQPTPADYMYTGGHLIPTWFLVLVDSNFYCFIIKTYDWDKYHCNHFMASTFDFIIFSP